MQRGCVYCVGVSAGPSPVRSGAGVLGWCWSATVIAHFSPCRDVEMSALQPFVRSTSIKCEEHSPSQWFSAFSSTGRRYIQVSSKPDSKVSNLPVAVAVSGHGLLQNCYLKANIFYCIIYSIQKLLQNDWTTLIRVAVRWVLAISGHSWPVHSGQLDTNLRWQDLCPEKILWIVLYTGCCWPSGRGKMKVEKLQIIEKTAETFLILQKDSLTADTFLKLQKHSRSCMLGLACIHIKF